MALHIIKPKQRFHSNPSLLHLFSTSSTPPPPPQQPQNESTEQPPDHKASTYFSTMRSTLKQKPQINLSNSGELRRNLNEFRKRSAAPPAKDWQDIYQQKVLSKSGDGSLNKAETLNFDTIKQNLRLMRPSNETRFSNLSSFQSLKSENVGSSVSGEGLPYSVFGGGNEEEEEKGRDEMKTELFRSYDARELGEKLRMFRPEGKKEEGWFSLAELNQRLVKLREAEEEAARNTKTGLQFEGLRAGLQQTKDDQAKKKVACMFSTLSVFRQRFITVLNILV